jgi:hypothetical protein
MLHGCGEGCAERQERRVELRGDISIVVQVLEPGSQRTSMMDSEGSDQYQKWRYFVWNGPAGI